MAKTAAERQADYRARRATAADGSGEHRLNTWVSTAAHLALARIAHRNQVTQRETLERLILAEDEKMLASLEMDTPAWDAYFERSKKAQPMPKPAPVKRGAVTEKDGAAKAPSYGMLESRVVLLNAENIGLADTLQKALDEVAALKDALAVAANVTRHGKSSVRNPRRTN